MPFLSSASKATKITLGALAGLIVLLGVAPYLITWNQYKSVITDKVSAQLGRPMQIDGNVRFSLLPRPEAHVSDIVIKNPAGTTSENFLQLEQLDVAVALFPLLRKEIEIEKITLVKPAITLEKTADGGNNWTFTPTNAEKRDDATTDEAEAATALKINDIALEDAYVRYVDTPAKTVKTVGPINANLSLESLQGPYTAKGDITYHKTPIRFDVTTEEQNTETNAMPVTANILVGNKAMKANFTGSVTRGDAFGISGNLVADSGDLAGVLAAFAADGKRPDLPDALKKFDLKSQLLYTADKIALPGLQLKGDGLDVIADTVINLGARTRVTLDIGRLVVPASLIGGDTPNNETKKTANEPLVKALENGFASAQKILDVAFPATPLDLIVSSDAITLPGKPGIRDLRLAASSDTNQFTLQSLQAKLAGNTRVNISARAPLNEAKKPTQIVTSIALSSDNLGQAFSSDPASIGKNDPISVSTTATLTNSALRLNPLQITQQGQTLNGDVLYQPAAKMPLNVSLRGGALNLDSFKAKDAPAATADTKNQKTGDSVLNRLQGFKAQFDVAIDRVITGGKNVRNVTAKGVFSDAGLNLQQATASLEGMALNAKGTVGKLSPLGQIDMTVGGQTSNLSQTLQALGNSQARNLGATSFGGTVKGDLARIALNIDAKLDQGSGKIKGDLLGADTGPIGFDGTLSLNHPETATIARNFAKLNPQRALGPFALNATIDYAGETIKADDFVLKLGSAGGLKGSVNITPQQGRKKIDATISSDRLDLAAVMGDDAGTAKNGAPAPSTPDTGWSKEPLNLDIIRNLDGKATVKIGELLYKGFTIRNFNNDLAFANNTLTLNDLSADLFDAGRIIVDGTLKPAAQGQAHQGQFNLNVKDTDAAKFFNALDSKLFAKGTFSAQQALSFRGASPFAMINSLSGDGQFAVRDGVVNGMDLDALAAKFDRPNSVTDFTSILQQAKAGGTTAIGDVDVPVSIRNGVATIAQTAVKTQLTETNFGGTADLASKTVNMGGQVRFTEQTNMPPLGLKLTGPFSAPRKEFDSQSVAQFALQKATGKYQDKAVEKIDKLLGNKLPGGAGGALGSLLGLPTKSAVPAASAPAATTAPVVTPSVAPSAAPAPATSSTPSSVAPAASPPAPAAAPEPVAAPEPAASATPAPATDAAPAPPAAEAPAAASNTSTDEKPAE